MPWVTVLLIAGCVGVTLYGATLAAPLIEQAEQDLARAEEYFGEHPYLEPRPPLEARLSSSYVERERAAYEHAREQRRALPTPRGVTRRQQETLDAMLLEVEATLEQVPSRRLGLRPDRGEPARWFSYFLLHAGTWHVTGNALLLLFLGLYLERSCGSALFALSTLAAIGTTGLAFVAAHPDLDRPLIGMNGALSGLLALFAVRFWSHRGKGFYAFTLAGGALWLVVPVWLGLDGSLPHPGAELLPDPPRPGHGFSALGGGLAGGALAAFAVALVGPSAVTARERPGVERRRSDSCRLLDRARRARERGDLEQALALLSEALEQPGEVRGAALAMWSVARDLGRHADAASAMVRLVRDEVRADQRDAAVEHWLELTECGLPEDVDPPLLIRMALLLREAEHPVAAVAALRAALDRSQGAATATVATRVARVAQHLDPQTAEAAAWTALGSLELTLEERQALEGLLEEIGPGPEALRAWAREGAGGAAGDLPPEDSAAPARVPIDIESDQRGLDATLAVPTSIDEEGIGIATEDGAKRRVAYADVQAIAVAAVHGLGRKPVILVDLVLNWMSMKGETLHVIRLRGDRFDPRRFAPSCESPSEALRALLGSLLDRSGATPLPDEASVRGRPFASFPALESYHDAVLMVETRPPDAYAWSEPD